MSCSVTFTNVKLFGRNRKGFNFSGMQVLMELSQLILEKKKAQNHTKRQRAKILITLTLMKLDQKLIQQNGGQSMKL